MPRIERDGTCRKSAKRRLFVELLESRQLMAAAPLGALPYDTGEFLLGRVAVTPVLLESNGQIDDSTEDWTAEEINQVLENVQTGMQWWVDTLAGITDAHQLEFVIDDSFATTPVPTPYEPISRKSNDYSLYVGQFLLDQGYDGLSLTLDDAIRDFNNLQREKLNTDWSFTIFVVDSSNDPDGQFDHTGSFRQAFAFAGGLFFVTPSNRPASTYTHETGHMFWARDEYPNSASHYARRGYYNSQNSNAVDDAPPGFVQQPSIMSSGVVLQTAYDANTSSAATLAQLGWQDSDEDGIFDVLDVPLSLDVAAVYDAESRLLRVRGSASAVPLLNRNSAGQQSDITLNRVSRLEYRVNGGAWTTLSSPDQQFVLIDIETELVSDAIGIGPTLVELRAIDDQVGIASNVVAVASNQATPGNNLGVHGFAYVDENDNAEWSAAETLVSGVSVSILESDSIFRGRLEPDDSVGTIYSNPLADLEIRSVGNQVDGRVGAFAGASGTGAASFHYGSIFGGWGDSWTRIRQELSIEIANATTSVSIVAVGKGADSIARMEGYDEFGTLIARTTSGPLGVGESATLSLSDSEGRIKSIRAFGTGGTSVSLDDFRYGPDVTATSSVFGTFDMSGLPDGTYTVSFASPSSQYEIVEPTRTVIVENGTAEPLTVRAIEVTSPWTNPQDPLDVNARDGIQPLDALIIINELNRSGSRLLTSADSTPPYLDVTGDWQITPIDALRIINFLNTGGGVPASGEGGGFGVFADGSPSTSGEFFPVSGGFVIHTGTHGADGEGERDADDSGQRAVDDFFSHFSNDAIQADLGGSLKQLPKPLEVSILGHLDERMLENLGVCAAFADEIAAVKRK